MTGRNTLLVAAVALLCISAAGPALAGVSTSATDRTAQKDDGSVEVTVGAQLSTVVTATSEEVRTDFENAALDRRLEDGNDSERAAAIADRLATLENRSATLEREYENATAAYEDGDITRSEYAQRIAELNARARGVLEGYESLEERAADVDELELRAAGVNESDVTEAKASLERFTGAGAQALFEQFAGEQRGNADVEVDGGLSIEVENEDGERSREFERPRDRDADGSFDVSQAEALSTAEDALSAADGAWVVEEAETDVEDVAYEFEFVLRGNESGEAEVAVDGRTGTVFGLEEEIEARGEAEGDDRGNDDRGDDDRGGDDDGERLVILVESGTPGPGETVTLQVLADGQPAADAPVTLEDDPVGETDANGAITVTLPEDEATIEAEYGDADAEVEFEFESDDEDDENEGARLRTTGRVENGSVTVSVTYEGSPVPDAAVYANDERVATTGEDGTATFALADGEIDVDVDVVRGELEGELQIEHEDGAIVVDDGSDDDGDADSGDDGDDTDGDDGGAGDESESDDGDDGSEDETDGDGGEVLTSVIVEDGTVSLIAARDGAPVTGADVYANGDAVATTGIDGTATFDLPTGEDDVDVVVVSGDLEGEFEIEYEDGEVVVEGDDEVAIDGDDSSDADGDGGGSDTDDGDADDDGDAETDDGSEDDDTDS